METQRVIVGKRAPDFDLPCTRGVGLRDRATLASYRDRWLVLVFYPRDFSLVCPTELTALSVRMEEFRRRGCDVLGISTDSLETHERWLATPRNQGGLGALQFPLASDADGSLARAYGVLLEPQHIALRGMFIVDANGVLQYQAIHNLSVGRRSDDVLRTLAALESGGMCPEDWCVDCEPFDPTRELVPGNMLSHYRIEAEVGRGSFAAVYRAHDTVLDRTVALKVFQQGSLATPPAVLAEARAAAALNHPNVCLIYGVDDSEGVPLIAMEYLDGRSLYRVLENGPFSHKEAARVGRQIALGMSAAHDLGIVHGDLKPANILLTAAGVAKITDFGLARRESRSAADGATEDWTSARAGQVAGTPSYMSPEQTRGEPVTTASDVFSLGVTLYELTTRRRLFAGENVLQVFDRIRNVDAARAAAEVPEPFAAVLRDTLIREPGERRMTMAHIAELLESA